MTTKRITWMAALVGTLLMASLAVPAPAAAHCDSMDGPVVKAAQTALAAGDVALVLGWVMPEHESEIRSAFERTLRVRSQGAEARELADLWFYETLVRVHREGEGAPYTGLKPAGWEPPSLVAAADRVLVEGGIEQLADRVSGHVSREIREKYEQVKALEGHDPADVAAARRYVAAYVEYAHLLEGLYHQLHGGGHGATHGGSGGRQH
jgi:hypothetical protein